MDQHRSQTLLQYIFPLHLPLFPNTHNLLSLQILAFRVGEREGLKSFGPAASFYENRGLERKWLVQCTSFAHCSALCQPPPVCSSQREPRDVLAGVICAERGMPSSLLASVAMVQRTWGSRLCVPVPTARVRWRRQLAARGQLAPQH